MFLVDQTFNLHRDIILDRIFDFCDKNKEKINNFDQLSTYVVGLDFQSFPMVVTVGKSLIFKTKCAPHEKDEFPVETSSFRPITNIAQELGGSHVDEDGPKIIVQTQVVPVLGNWFPDVRSFFVTMHCEFRESFNRKWRARYYG
ncbi:hypothetical protein SERLA73DRAFT_189377 [Serpula lacrymans var. lacrymans S7.3]|uniref:Uncharacterized protein n=2 Tax=Serpula lacrymans var. lacrymans TaxID=341189 RepID=F8QDH5_SERL3|nr:uncharacterized protein SERLADRAFT_453943 [Serpula lacrymans var. lacrymans S7.9]EGN93646.1 hypothetical protein SERLA73DRAFT_189377 [Serpula lacrymans var. lacrymans S7.3]EGO19023.1 hypothetical protein SERLADRAFT_453943 [Serpula lacrymans var. lacrymans S7.9]